MKKREQNTLCLILVWSYLQTDDGPAHLLILRYPVVDMDAAVGETSGLARAQGKIQDLFLPENRVLTRKYGSAQI